MHEINIVAAIAAGILGYCPGGLWYSKAMFLRRRACALGIGIDAQPAGGHGAKIAIGVAPSVVAAIVFALIAAALSIHYMFEGRSLAFRAINAGYHVVQFALFGLVIGLWP